MFAQENQRYNVEYKLSDKKSRYFHLLGNYTPNIFQDSAVYKHVVEEDSYVVNKRNRVLAKNEKNWGNGQPLRQPIISFDKTRYIKIFESEDTATYHFPDTVQNIPEYPIPENSPFSPFSPFIEASVTSSETLPYQFGPFWTQKLNILEPIVHLNVHSLLSAFESTDEICPQHLDRLDKCGCKEFDLKQHFKMST